MVLLVQFKANGKTVLLAPLAISRARTSLHAADANSDHVAHVHAEVGPNGIDILFLDPDQGNAGSTRHLDGLDLVLLRNIGHFTEGFGRDHPAGQMGSHGVGLPIPLNNNASITVVKHGYATSLNFVFGAPQTGHLSGAPPTCVWPQTSQT